LTSHISPVREIRLQLAPAQLVLAWGIQLICSNSAGSSEVASVVKVARRATDVSSGNNRDDLGPFLPS
jgi:hypothetical protein